MDGIHFNVGWKFQTAEIAVKPAVKGSSVGYLLTTAFSGPEAHLAFQVDVAGGKKPHVQVSIQSPDRHIQFRMIDQDVIRRLPLFNQGRNDFIFLVQLSLCHVDAGSGIPELFTVFAVSKPGIVSILMRDGAVVDLFGTAVADIRSLVQAVAAFLSKSLHV